MRRLELANEDDSSDEGGWGDDDAAPTLKELPKLPQVEEAQKAPWLRSGLPLLSMSAYRQPTRLVAEPYEASPKCQSRIE